MSVIPHILANLTPFFAPQRSSYRADLRLACLHRRTLRLQSGHESRSRPYPAAGEPVTPPCDRPRQTITKLDARSPSSIFRKPAAVGLQDQHLGVVRAQTIHVLLDRFV